MLKGFSAAVGSVALFAALAATPSALAASAVTFNGQPVRTISAGGSAVAVYPEATVTLEDADPAERSVYLTGAGIRTKRVVVNVPVYIATSYIDNDGGIPRNDPLSAIRDADTKVLQLTFVREVSGREIAGAFAESLRLNGISADEPAIRRIFDALPQTIPARAVVTFVGYDKGDGNEVVRFELPGKVITSEGPDLALKIWTMWFGVASDRGLEQLKGELIGNRRS